MTDLSFILTNLQFEAIISVKEVKSLSKEKKKHSRIGLIILILILLLLLLALGFICYKYFFNNESDELETQYNEQTQLFAKISPDEDTNKNLLSDALAINSQTVAWISIPDTTIDYPIVQCEDNDYYIDHSFEGEYYQLGCPFLDYRNSSDFSDFNSIIYGHNWSNKYVFAALLDFKNQTYFEEHSQGTLTLPDELYTVSFFACVVVESDSFLYSVNLPAKSDRITYLKQVQESAVASIDFEPEDYADKRLIILSTCSRDSGNSRTALVGYIND